MLPEAGVGELFDEVHLTEDDLYESREERKFVVPLDVAGALRERLSARLAIEEFIPGRQRTLIHSVYFDSEDFSLYRESLSIESSLKFRLRGYATWGARDGIDPMSFFECKLGMKEVGTRKKKRKLRFQLPHMLATSLFDRQAVKRATTGMLSLAPKPKFWTKALKFVNERKLLPQLTVCYEREAYVSEDGRLRVTLDEHFRASRIWPNNTSRLDEPAAQLPGVVILEVKFIGAFPAWLADELSGLGLAPEGQSFSKFKTAVPMVFPQAVPAG